MSAKTLSRRFCAWALCGFAAPVTIYALGRIFERPTASHGPSLSWQAQLTEWAFAIQVMYVLFGLIICRGERLAALVVGVSLIIPTTFIALATFWAVTGTTP